MVDDKLNRVHAIADLLRARLVHRAVGKRAARRVYARDTLVPLGQLRSQVGEVSQEHVRVRRLPTRLVGDRQDERLQEVTQFVAMAGGHGLSKGRVAFHAHGVEREEQAPRDPKQDDPQPEPVSDMHLRPNVFDDHGRAGSKARNNPPQPTHAASQKLANGLTKLAHAGQRKTRGGGYVGGLLTPPSDRAATGVWAPVPTGRPR